LQRRPDRLDVRVFPRAGRPDPDAPGGAVSPARGARHHFDPPERPVGSTGRTTITMKIKTIIGVAAIAGTGAVGFVGSPASAACGVSITADNDENREVTVDWEDSYVRTRQFGIAGPWKRIGTYETDVAANATVTRAFTLDLPCSLDRQYKLEVEDGANSWWEYENETGPGGDWTDDISPWIDLED
jgi:hypothetical protein